MADVHIHSNFSDGISTIKEILDFIEEQGTLSVVAISDHNTIKGSMLAASLSDRYSFDVIVGEEIMSTEGEVIGLFINKEVPRGLSAAETIDRVHEQGGLAVAPHPFVVPIDGIGGRGLWFKTAKEKLDGIESLSGNPLLGYANLLASKALKDMDVAHFGGSDAHVIPAIASSVTVFEGTSAEDFRRAIENRETYPLKRTTPVRVMQGYWGKTLEVFVRHSKVLKRWNRAEIVDMAEWIFWKELQEADGARFEESRRQVLENYAKILGKGTFRRSA